MKKAAILIVHAIGSVLAVVFLVFLSPLLLVMGLLSGISKAWDRFELWAYYDGDTAKRDKDRWKNS